MILSPPRSRSLLPVVFAVGCLAVTDSAVAAAPVYAVKVGTANWSDPTAWTLVSGTANSPSFPNGIDNVASFQTQGATGNAAIATTALDLNVTLGQITGTKSLATWTINDPSGYSFTMQSTSGTSTIGYASNLSAGIIINPSVSINNALSITTGPGGNGAGTNPSLTLNGALTGTGNVTVSTSTNGGRSTVALASVNTVGMLSFTGTGTSTGSSLSQTTVGSIGANVTSVSKTSASPLTFNGTNMYVGNTTVSTGALTLSTTASTLFQITNTGSNEFLGGGTGTAAFNGKFALDLSSLTTNGSWTLVDSALTSTYGSNFSVVDNSGVLTFTKSGTTFTATSGMTTYSFAETTGVFMAVPESSCWGFVAGGGCILLAYRRLRRTLA